MKIQAAKVATPYLLSEIVALFELAAVDQIFDHDISYYHDEMWLSTFAAISVDHLLRETTRT